MEKVSSILLNGVDIELTYKEYGFQEVRETFPTAEYVYISTFSLPMKKDSPILLALRDVPPNAKIVIVCGIPRGVNSLRYAEFLDSVHLRPDDANARENFKVYFLKQNHSKIIATNQVAYIGSANFSQDTKNHFEAGVIVRNGQANDFIHMAFTKLIEHAKEYAKMLSYPFLVDFSKFSDKVLELRINMQSDLSYLEPNEIPEYIIKNAKAIRNKFHTCINKNANLNYRNDLSRIFEPGIRRLIRYAEEPEKSIDEFMLDFHEKNPWLFGDDDVDWHALAEEKYQDELYANFFLELEELEHNIERVKDYVIQHLRNTNWMAESLNSLDLSPFSPNSLKLTRENADILLDIDMQSDDLDSSGSINAINDNDEIPF